MYIKLLLKFFLIICFSGSCQKEKPSQNVSSITITTSGINGIQKVNDFPLYAMSYTGDYHFDDFLITGKYPVLAQNTIKSSQGLPWACSCIAAMESGKTNFFGRNFDWNDCIPLLLVTKPTDGYASVSIVDIEYLGFNRNNLPDNPSTNSRLRSSPYLPFDGMNEKGVSVGMMAVQSASCTIDPAKVTIGELDVIRLVLDYAATVDEAIQLIRKYNVKFVSQPIHYMIADKNAKSAIIEFVNGEMKVIPNNEFWQVCTNFIVTESSAPANAPCSRYNTAYSFLNQKHGALDLSDTRALMEDVSQTNTIWTTIYDPQNNEAYIAMSRKYSEWLKYKLIK